MGFGFLSISLGFIGNFIFSLGSLFLEVCIFTGYVLTVIFTNRTFYKDTESKAKLVLIIVIILGMIQIIFFIINERSLYYIRVSLDVPYTLLVFNWLAFSSYRVYLRIKIENIQPWIKLRYKMIFIFSFILSLNNILEFFQPRGVFWGDPNHPISLIVFGLTAIIVVCFSIGFSLAWLMPNALKKYFNRNYTPIKDVHLSEEELKTLLRKDLDEH
ncbi:MAG: hypothetical protein ACFFCV_04715 [Promethearchaeota archaeon]